MLQRGGADGLDVDVEPTKLFSDPSAAYARPYTTNSVFNSCIDPIPRGDQKN
jgi:hypothetical protein